MWCRTWTWRFMARRKKDRKVLPPKRIMRRAPAPVIPVQRLLPPPPMGSVEADLLIESARGPVPAQIRKPIRKPGDPVVLQVVRRAEMVRHTRVNAWQLGQRETIRPRMPDYKCEKHKSAYRIKGSRLCFHPDCLRRWVLRCSGTSGYIARGLRFLEDLGSLEDFVQFLVLRFLEDRKAKKDPMIRPIWVFFNLKEYFARHRKHAFKEMSYEEAVEMLAHTAAEERDDDGQTASELVESHLDDVRDRWAQGVMRAILYNEVHDRMVEDGHRLQMMVLRGDITKYDLWMLRYETRGFLGDSVLAQVFGLEFAKEWTRLWAHREERQGWDASMATGWKKKKTALGKRLRRKSGRTTWRPR